MNKLTVDSIFELILSNKNYFWKDHFVVISFGIDVKRFVPQKHEDKVPHMGWNTIGKTNSKLFEGFTEEEFVYFVHSFYVPVCDFTAAETDYIHPFSAALHKDNFYATQFHPEKSGKTGERVLRNFLDL